MYLTPSKFLTHIPPVENNNQIHSLGTVPSLCKLENSMVVHWRQNTCIPIDLRWKLHTKYLYRETIQTTHLQSEAKLCTLQPFQISVHFNLTLYIWGWDRSGSRSHVSTCAHSGSCWPFCTQSGSLGTLSYVLGSLGYSYNG